jgi:hypothetical protein
MAPWFECPFGATAAANLQPFRAVESAELLVVHADAFTIQQDVQASVAEAPAPGRQLAQPNTHDNIVGSGASVAN